MAALAALPLIQQAEKSVASAVSQGVSSFLGQTTSASGSASGGQNMPGAAHKAPIHTASATGAQLSAGVMGALLSLQAGEASAKGGSGAG